MAAIRVLSAGLLIGAFVAAMWDGLHSLSRYDGLVITNVGDLRNVVHQDSFEQVQWFARTKTEPLDWRYALQTLISLPAGLVLGLLGLILGILGRRKRYTAIASSSDGGRER